MSELKLSEYLINRFAIFNKDKPLKSEAKLVEMAKALEKELKATTRGAKIDLLKQYSEFLTKNGYMDTDWNTEEPFAIDEFLKEFNKLE